LEPHALDTTRDGSAGRDDVPSAETLLERLGALFPPGDALQIERLAPWTKGAWTMGGAFRGWLEEPGKMPARLEGEWNEPDELVGTCGRCNAFGTCVHLAALLVQVDSDGAYARPDASARSAPALDADLPRALAFVEAPRPRLLLAKWKVSSAAGKQTRLEGAVLHFGYGPREFREGDPSDTAEWEADGARWRAVRDDAAEARLVRRLEAMDLRRRGSSPVRTFPDDATAEWVEFLADTADELRAEGWAVECAPGWTLIWEEPGAWHGEWSANPGGWFDLALSIEIEGRAYDLLAICRQILSGSQSESILARLDQGRAITVRIDDMLVRLPAERMRPILSALGFLLEGEKAKLRIPGLLAAQFGDMGIGEDSWKGLDLVRTQKARLAEAANLEPAELPRTLQAGLRPYQLQGYTWLQWLRRSGFGGILADDMGLGKTLQTLAHLLMEQESGRATSPSLVVCPTSLLANWSAEARRFAPTLRVVVLHGADRSDHRDAADAADIVITTYPLLARDEEWLRERTWHLLVLDEAQTLKNARAQARGVVARLSANHRLALTGTPMENHLGEIWSLVDLLHPGLLGSEGRFTRQVRQPIERAGNTALRERLSAIIAPFLLRRTKEQVATELPGKTEIVQYVELQGAQRDLYEAVRAGQDSTLHRILDERGWETSSLAILEALLRIRQVCCDPRLLPESLSQGCASSAKIDWLTESVPEMVEEGRRILMFSQFTSFLDLVGSCLDDLAVPFVRLDGSTHDRGDVVRRFQDGEAPVFLLSLKAGGTGLNLTRADTVIFLDPWWNPAAERQAADRAHRIGQNQPVFVYRLVAQGTIEERILALQERKTELADALFENAELSASRLTPGELQALLQPIG